MESCVLVQLSINIETFTERLFSPVESERTFPLVESGDTVATLVAGLVLFFFSGYLTTYRALWIVIGILALLVPLFLKYHSFVRSLPGLCLYRKQILGSSSEHHERLSFSDLRKSTYIRYLILIVIAQWFFSVVLEFLFTYSISSQVAFGGDLVPAVATGVENVLIHEFGFMQILFAGAALLSHFFLAGRVISGVGIGGSMVLHPIVSFLSLATMIVNFSVFSTVLSRINFEVTGVIFRNAYQASYYVFHELKSQFVRLFLDGIVRPIGTLAGTLFLLFCFLFSSSQYYITLVLVGLFCVLLVFLLAIIALQGRYTGYVISQLKDPHTPTDLRLSLLDVLAQRGHEDHAVFLLQLYREPEQSPLVLMKLLEFFSTQDAFFADILDRLHHQDRVVRFHALRALSSFEQRHFFEHNSLSLQTLIGQLKSFFVHESDPDLRFQSLLLLAKFRHEEVTTFLLERLGLEQGASLVALIYACDASGDPAFLEYISSLLSSPYPRVWASTLVILTPHHRFARQISEFFAQKLTSDLVSDRCAVAFVLSHTLPEHSLTMMEKRARSTDTAQEKLLLAYGLMQLGSSEYHALFLEALFSGDVTLSLAAQRLYAQLPYEKFSVFIRSVERRALFQLHTLMRSFRGATFHELSLKELHSLRQIYTLLHVTEEVIRLDALLEKKDSLYRPDSSYLGGVPLPISLYV
mgnify:FL=1